MDSPVGLEHTPNYPIHSTLAFGWCCCYLLLLPLLLLSFFFLIRTSVAQNTDIYLVDEFLSNSWNIPFRGHALCVQGAHMCKSNTQIRYIFMSTCWNNNIFYPRVLLFCAWVFGVSTSVLCALATRPGWRSIGMGGKTLNSIMLRFSQPVRTQAIIRYPHHSLLESWAMQYSMFNVIAWCR